MLHITIYTILIYEYCTRSLQYTRRENSQKFKDILIPSATQERLMRQFIATALVFAAFSTPSGEGSSDNSLPQQIHLALAGGERIPEGTSHTGMRVNWYTEANVSQTVVFGSSLDNMTTVAFEEEASPRQYLSNAGFHHVAMINAVDSGFIGGDVFYKVGSNATGWSSTYHFDTRPFAPDAITSVSVFGDLGYQNSTYRKKDSIIADVANDLIRNAERLTKHWSATWTRDTIQSLKNRGAIDAVIHLGDIGCEFLFKGLGSADQNSPTLSMYLNLFSLACSYIFYYFSCTPPSSDTLCSFSSFYATLFSQMPTTRSSLTRFTCLMSKPTMAT